MLFLIVLSVFLVSIVGIYVYHFVAIWRHQRHMADMLSQAEANAMIVARSLRFKTAEEAEAERLRLRSIFLGFVPNGRSAKASLRAMARDIGLPQTRRVRTHHRVRALLRFAGFSYKPAANRKLLLVRST
nr:hypothetical protein [uncultured bacterium]